MLVNTCMYSIAMYVSSVLGSEFASVCVYV